MHAKGHKPDACPPDYRLAAYADVQSVSTVSTFMERINRFIRFLETTLAFSTASRGIRFFQFFIAWHNQNARKNMVGAAVHRA